MSDCEMSIEKCLSCPMTRKILSLYTQGIAGKMVAPFKLVCQITDEELEIRECINKYTEIKYEINENAEKVDMHALEIMLNALKKCNM